MLSHQSHTEIDTQNEWISLHTNLITIQRAIIKKKKNKTKNIHIIYFPKKKETRIRKKGILKIWCDIKWNSQARIIYFFFDFSRVLDSFLKCDTVVDFYEPIQFYVFVVFQRFDEKPYYKFLAAGIYLLCNFIVYSHSLSLESCDIWKA